MEHFQREVFQSGSNPSGFGLGMWMTPGWFNKDHEQEFLEHINSIDPAINFTVEGTQRNGSIPFLDTLVTPEADYSLSFTMYHKPTHTDQYLQWDSHHNSIH